MILCAIACLSFIGPTIQSASATMVLPESLPLGGYTARGNKTSEPGGDELRVRVRILKQGAESVTLVVLEQLTVPESLVEQVAEQLPETNLWMVATHTHCAPDSQMLNSRMTFSIPGIASYKSRILSAVASRIVGAVKKAASQPLTPVTSLEAKSFRLYQNRARRKLGTPDNTATMVRMNGSDFLFAYAAHPVNYDETELKLRSDWPGTLMRQTGALAVTGAIGDVSPDFGEGKPQEKIDRFVELALDSSDKTPSRSVFDCERETIKFIEEPIDFPVPIASPALIQSQGIPEVLAAQLVGRFAPKESHISAIRLGKLILLGVPGEPTGEMGILIRDYGRSLGLTDVVVVSHVNGWAGYMLRAEDYRRQGYEASLCFYGPSTGDIVVEAAKRALRNLTRAS